MAKGCVYIPKTGKDAGKVFGSKESLAAHMNYTPALTDMMAKFEQSGGKADIDSVTKWLSDNGYLKEKPAGKPSRRERLAKMFEEPKVETKPTQLEMPLEAPTESKPQTSAKVVRDKIEYVSNKLRDKVKGLVGNAKGTLSRNEANIFKKEIESLEKKAIQQGTFSYDEKRGNANYEKVDGKEQKVNTYEADGYKIEYESTPKSSFVEITTPSGERIRLIDPTYKNQSNQEVVFFPAAQTEDTAKPKVEVAPEVESAQELNKEAGIDLFVARKPIEVKGEKFVLSQIKENNNENTFIVEDEKGNEIGRAQLSADGNYVENIRIDEKHRRKGLASSIYNFIEDRKGIKLSPSPIKQSKEAKALWDKRSKRISVTEKPKSKLEEKKALDQSVNELINKKNRYNKISKTRKPLAGKLLNEIKEEADALGFALSPALGGNIKLVSKKDGKVVARRSVDRGFNKERNEKVKAAKGMASDFTFGLRGSILLYFLNGGKISTTSSELGKDSKELIAAKKAGIVSDTGTSASSIAKEDLPEMGAVVFDELDAVAEIQGIVASFENKEQMEDELVDMLDKLNRDMEEAAKYESESQMRAAIRNNELTELDEDQLNEYYESLSEDEKVKTIEDYEKFYQEIEREQPEQGGQSGAGISPSEGETQEETAREPKSKRLQRAEELRAKAQDLRDASGGTLMAGPKLLAAAYEAYAAILETTENIIDAIKKFKATKEYKDLDVKGKKELDVVLATDAVEEEISSGRNPQEAVDDLIGSQEWYQSLPANQKEQLDEILKDDFGVTPKAKTGIKATIANVIDNYYKGDRQSKLDNKRILESDPKLKYIYDNISKINKQLQDAGVITDKTDGCP